MSCMNTAQWCENLIIEISEEQEFACAYLERRGYRFLIDFGYENAEDIAAFHRRHELQQKTTFLRRDQL